MPEQQQFIVAVGASAGGLEALTSFFDHTPLDSVSYVIIPHLSPNIKSQMVEILSRYSTLEVVEATEGMEVEKNKVYLIPNTKYMGIKEGQLYMFEKQDEGKPHMTIDSFFTSLAKERGDKALGVILSGVGTDGSRGAVAIKNAGGLIMVQDPLDAKFNGMPIAAISACNPRHILSAEAIPMAIQQHVDERNSDNSLNVPFSEAFIPGIVKLIKEQYPFDFNDYKLPTLIRRINRRMLHNNIKEEHLFLSFLHDNPSEIELLISDFLIGVTSFFRDAEAFQVLENEVIPNILEHNSGTGLIKIWVACCATGEEAYSLAILIKEQLNKSRKETEVKIFATDINRTALTHAGAGVFSASIAKTVSKERLEAFFDKREVDYKIKPEIRKMLIFARHDLTKNPPYCDVDLISCRNMLIYIKSDVQKEILSKLGFGLKKGGYLFLGSSENLSVVKENYIEISAKWKIYQNLRTRRRINLENALTAPLSDRPTRQFENLPAPKAPVPKSALNSGMTEVILSESGFCGVSIDNEGNVLQAFGDLSPYLRAERFNFNLKELLPENLAMAYSASFLKVQKNNQRVRINSIEFTEPDSLKNSIVDLIVSPFRDSKSKAEGMMVLFKASGDIEGDQHRAQGEVFEIDNHTRDHIMQLEEELHKLKQDLLSSTELLESSKEAMQAYNEELLSANEEMQSANEELQSINEELDAVNTEHKYTIADLSNLNDDLNNYFRSNINGQLFVDQDILLKKFSPGAIKHINIQDSDIGRPLSNITTNIKFETLIDDIKRVIQDGEIVMKEVESTEGKIYQVMTSPYLRKIDEKIYGAIITFYDISELKKIQNELDRSNKMLTLATESAEIGTWSIDANTQELISSLGFRKIFGFSLDREITFENVLAQILSDHRSLFIESFKASINTGEKFELDCPVHVLQDEKVRWVRVIGNLTYSKAGKAEYLTGILQDITDYKLDDIRKNDFISIVSHELKTPLTSLNGFIQILLPRAQKSEDELAAKFLNKANNQVKRMTALINGFLNVSLLEKGKIHLERQLFQIDELVEEIAEEVSSSTSTHNIIKLSGCKVTVNADREKIGQVINNILSNAVKYSPKQSSIEINCMESTSSVQVSIKDEGAGINPSDQQKLFDRYFRIERKDLSMIPGFGIGLYLSSEIIQRHNGKIWVESEIGMGSKFCFSLPLA
jgi:two-component system CheB/CheR fusion protein